MDKWDGIGHGAMYMAEENMHFYEDDGTNTLGWFVCDHDGDEDVALYSTLRVGSDKDVRN